MEIIFNNGIISENGFQIYDGFDSKEIVLLINITNDSIGVEPTLVFTIEDVDPIDQSTPIGDSSVSSIITSSITTSVKLNNSISNTIKISWAVDGTTPPTFTGVNVSLIQKTNIISDQADPLIIKNQSSISSSLTNISASASSVTLLSANQNRLGATFFNDSSNILYLKLGATASTTSFTVKILSGGYYELPFEYIGIIDGIWDGTNGAVRITELN